MKLVWITRDRRKLTPNCMTCAHLRNSVARILRLRWRMKWLPILLAEIDRRCKEPETKPQRELETEL